MSAPMGSWSINANGTTGSLILSASSTGGITGSVFGDPLTAVWDETSQILSFSRSTQAGPSFAFEVYTGTLFQPYDTPNGLAAGQGVPLLLAGNFGNFATAGGPFGPFDNLGWFASNTQKFKEKEAKDSKDKDTKEHKDKDKEKEHLEKIHADKVGGTETLPQTSFAPQEQADGGAGPGIRIATGRSFISSEERPSVGGLAVQAGKQH